ncbi:hypothetical protein [Mangrovibrevibacter kandeliae]|uniref:hypothetical protein n=1 Tax=Mangrovibrevibacter kandeliae TaxID=2968473 RepID=UPI0021199C5E|nr:hypothetical protein [Aurantimonas sp. CSK15Z-1]MCQ8783040.1 hypothetical protein [Aurantimonas sp. CSK15Z-1]
MFALKINDPVVLIPDINTGVTAAASSNQELEADVYKDVNRTPARYLKQDIMPPTSSSLRTQINGEFVAIKFDHDGNKRVATFHYASGDIYYHKVKNGVRITRYMSGRVKREVL